LWAQLDIAYFLGMTRRKSLAVRAIFTTAWDRRPVVKARLAPFGEGLQ